MARNKTGREMLLAEIGRLEGLLNVRAADEDAEGKDKETACDKAKKSSEKVVEQVSPDTSETGPDDTRPKVGSSKKADFVGEVPVDIDPDAGLMEDVLDADFDGSDVLEAFTASETEPGIEDEITQDKFDEVEEEVGADDIPTDDTTHDVVAGEYVGRLAEASTRLDRVASYLEKSGQVKLAFRIDRLADALDSERARLSK